MAAGPSIAGYVDVRRIGRGGLGDVYSARQESTGRDVAIKVLRDVSDSSVAWHRTRRELTALLALSGHANVIQIVELLELDEGPALVMEYAPGGSVADLLEARGTTFDADETVFVGRQVAAALVAAHERGIVHRDIKPQNLLIDEGGQVKLCDFGIAAITRDDEYRNRTNAISMRYASPEDLEHDVEVGAPSDIYSLGATLLHLVHGAPPTLKERLAPWDPPFVDDPRVAAVDRVIARCLHPNASVRPTARAVLDSFDGLAAGSGDDRVTALPLVPRRAAASELDEATDDRVTAAEHTTEDHPADAAPDAELAGLLGRAGAPPDAVRAAPADVEVGPDEPTGAPLVRPRPDDRRVGRLAVAVGAVLVVLIGVLVIWPADADAPTSTRSASAGPVTASTPDSSTVPAPTASIGAVPLATLPRPEGLPPLDSVDWTAGDVGDCLVQLDGVEALAVVHCDEPHDLQRVTVGALDELERLAELDEYDQDLIRAAVTDACAQQFVGFVGNDVVDSELALVTAQPSAASWADGDRNYGCYVGRNGYRITGDASNSGW